MTTPNTYTSEDPVQHVNFRFEYSLESQKNELGGKEYMGYGVSAKMIDEQGRSEVMSIQDVTLDQEVAWDLIQLLDASKISPMCLKMFVENFLVNQTSIY